MAGWEDSRDYIGVLGVSYFLKAVFTKVKSVKFLIVINEISLKDPRGDGIIKTINNFINMFDLKGMNEGTKT